MTTAEILKIIFKTAIKAGADQADKGTAEFGKQLWQKIEARLSERPIATAALAAAKKSQSEAPLAKVAPFLEVEMLEDDQFANELIAIAQEINAAKQPVQRLDALRAAYKNLQLLPLLTPEELKELRVEYGGDVIADLEQLIEDCSANNNQMIFAGHRGCGKSTLLSEFSHRLENRYFTVFFSISDLIEMSDINHINILFAIAVQMMAKAESEQIAIAKHKKDSFNKWFSTRTRTEEEGTSAEGEVGFDLFSIIKVKLKTDNAMRDEIKTEFKKNFRDLVDTINLIATEIKLASKKEIIVIIDDLDKLDLGVVKDIFQDNIKALLQPQFIIIYTIPIATLRDAVLKYNIEVETNNRILVMPVLKLYKKDESHLENAQPLDETICILREVLRKRIHDDLIESEIAEKIILSSGGVLRELVRIANECCRLALKVLRQNSQDEENLQAFKINREIFDEAEANLRNDFAITLGKTDYEILKTTYHKLMPDDPKQQVFLDLLHGVYVIEYRNRDTWYDLHPLVIELLRIRELIL